MADWPTPADIVRELARTRESLVEAVAELRQVREQQTAQRAELEDHDRRIGRLEIWRAMLVGGWAVLSVLVVVGGPLLAARLGG